MNHELAYTGIVDNAKICLIIPTYNNSGTLATVIKDVAAYTANIIVVNDGSTDNTEGILAQFPLIKAISYKDNKGKGWALRKGFEYAVNAGFDYAITIDSDGQHFAKDIPVFLQKLEIERKAIIIGARNMDQDSIPGKSSFGHKFSNFWFKVETGIAAPDTQSGYRLYPIYQLKDTHYFTVKYEFEIEVLVRAAWKGIKIESVPVSVFYAPKGERVSHFRPFKDFTRISILNTILVTITFLFIKPRDFFRTLFNKKKLNLFINEHLLHPHHSDRSKALSIAVGVFSGILPIWGFQIFVAIFLAFIFRLNKVMAIVASNISIPPMIPIIIFLSYKMGTYWMGNRVVDIPFSRNISLDTIRLNIVQYIYGSFTLAVITAIILGTLTYLLLKLFKRKMIIAE